MKNCDEMVNSLLERREQYEADKKQKRKTLTRTLIPICCVCLVALSGFGAWQSGIFNKTPIQSAEDAIIPGTKDWYGPGETEPTNQNAPQTNIIINKIDDISPQKEKNLFCLHTEDFVKINPDEYYGINVYPTVPKDLSFDGWDLGLYKRNGGTGEVYWEQNVLQYTNEDFTRSVNLEFKKGSLPVADYGLGEYVIYNGLDNNAENNSESKKTSVINGFEVFIGHSDGGLYQARFMYHDVGFIVGSTGLTQDEFIDVVSSLIK